MRQSIWANRSSLGNTVSLYRFRFFVFHCQTVGLYKGFSVANRYQTVTRPYDPGL